MLCVPVCDAIVPSVSVVAATAACGVARTSTAAPTPTAETHRAHRIDRLIRTPPRSHAVIDHHCDQRPIAERASVVNATQPVQGDIEEGRRPCQVPCSDNSA